MTSASFMVSELRTGSSAMGRTVSKDGEHVEHPLEGLLAPRLGSDIYHFHLLFIARAQSQDAPKCQGGWEIQSPLESRRKGNGIIFTTGTHLCWSAGKLSEKQCWEDTPKMYFIMRQLSGFSWPDNNTSVSLLSFCRLG